MKETVQARLLDLPVSTPETMLFEMGQDTMYKLPDALIREYDHTLSMLVENADLSLSLDQLDQIRLALTKQLFILPEGFESISEGFRWSGVSVIEDNEPGALFRQSVLQKFYNTKGELYIEDYVVDLFNPDQDVTCLGTQNVSQNSDGTVHSAKTMIVDKPSVFFITRLVREFGRTNEMGESESSVVKGYHKFRIYNPNKPKIEKIYN